MNENWIAVDWGTTNMRAWVLGTDGEVRARLRSDQGMGSLDPKGFESALLALIDPYLVDSAVTPVICCGMVGAKQGWVEAPYANVPCAVPGIKNGASPEAIDPRVSVHILPGVCQNDPPDVMRGEETQIRGYLTKDQKFDGVLCLPGTHTKWVHISAEEIVSFRTFMTGEVFSLLSQQSVLRHGLKDAEWDAAAFVAGIEDAIGRPQSFAAELFSLRASGLLKDTSAPKTRSRLSGLLVGMELAGAKPYWLGQRIVIIGDPSLSKIYQDALESQGCLVECVDGDEIALVGLASAYAEMQSQ